MSEEVKEVIKNHIKENYANWNDDKYWTDNMYNEYWNCYSNDMIYRIFTKRDFQDGIIFHDELRINLGFIGHKAEKLQSLFSEYSSFANDYGYFLRFENYTELKVNEGVTVYTNAFESEEHFMEVLKSKLFQTL
jgi:hypothetical protein